MARVMVADAIILKQHLGLSHALEFIRVVDPWCYPGEKTQSVVVLKSYVSHLFSKTRDAVKNVHQFTEESKSAFLHSPILIKERPALVRKPKGERGNSFPIEKKSTEGKDYPRNMSVDFRKLDNAALQKYVDHYQLAVQASLSNDELAVVVRVILYVSS